MKRPIRMAFALGLVVAIASMFAVLHASGSSAASAPTFTVTCGEENGAKAVFKWSGVQNLGAAYFSGNSYNSNSYVKLPAAPKSGTLEILAGGYGLDLASASAEFFSAPDKSGESVRIMRIDIPEAGCPG